MSTKRKRTKVNVETEFVNTKRKGRQQRKPPPSASESSDNASDENVTSDTDAEEHNGRRTPKSTRKTKTGKSSYSLDNLVEAHTAAQNGQSIRSAASDRGIPESTLRRYISERIVPGFDRRKQSPYFNEADEQQLADHISYMNGLGYPYSRWQVLELAADMMRVLGRSDRPAKQWFHGFLKRHPALAKTPNKTDSLSAPHEKNRLYFNELKNVLQTVKNQPEKIISVEETVIDVHNLRPKVLSRRGNKGCALRLDEVPVVSVIGAGNASGQNVPPYFITCQGEITPSNYKKILNGEIEGMKVTNSPIGWPSAEIYEDYFCNFLPKFVPLPAVALYDGNNTCVTLHVLERAKELGVHLFPLPNLSVTWGDKRRVLGAVFRRMFDAECKKLKLSGDKNITRVIVWSAIMKTYITGMSPSNLKAGFRNSAIFPFIESDAPNICADTLVERNPKNPSGSSRTSFHGPQSDRLLNTENVPYQPPYESESDHHHHQSDESSNDGNGDSNDDNVGGDDGNGDSDKGNVGSHDDNGDSNDGNVGGDDDNGDSNDGNVGGDDGNGDSDDGNVGDDDDNGDGDNGNVGGDDDNGDSNVSDDDIHVTLQEVTEEDLDGVETVFSDVEDPRLSGTGEEETLEIQDEVCVICQRPNPYMLEFVDPSKNVIVEWGQCHVCNRWVHLKFCCPFTQLGPNDTFKCPICAHMARQDQSQRKSRRLRTNGQRSFRLPSRDEIWDKIPSTPAGKSSYTHLKPRRLINNFIRENHKYNHDPVYTSGEDSVDDFVVPDDEVDSSGSNQSDSDGTSQSADSSAEDDDSAKVSADEGSELSANEGSAGLNSDRDSIDSRNNNMSGKLKGSSKQLSCKMKERNLKRKRRVKDSGETFPCDRGDRDSDDSDRGDSDGDSDDSDRGDSDGMDSKHKNNGAESDGSSKEFGRKMTKKTQRRRRRIKMLDTSSDSDSDGYSAVSESKESFQDRRNSSASPEDFDTCHHNRNTESKEGVMKRALKRYIQSRKEGTFIKIE